MSRTFRIDRNPYDDVALYKKANITLIPGITVLVGCNGSGKTTLLRIIKDKLEKSNTPVLSYNNLSDGGGNAQSSAHFHGQMKLLATLVCSSEGEQIRINIGQLARRIGIFVRDNPNAPELWILFDAVDSGFSVDNIDEIKTSLFNLIIDNNPNSDVYIVVSANEYEMCREENCFDVINGKYIRFADYEEYRNFILYTRKQKEKRYEN